MKVKTIPDGRTLWLLDSGWWVDPCDSEYFCSPDGVIYDRCRYSLAPRIPPKEFTMLVDVADIFTDEEFERYQTCFA